ncbi:unnamed protein product [Linum tenue]|uniref:Uncharacterized protein n=1 Tax=Linum tenue TaxID=586396 RepID=A0AAV0S811_9ROSI|nr:unnamed protein product [Linum tenue]
MATKFSWSATNKFIHPLSSSLTRLAHFGRSSMYPMTCFYRFLVVRVNSLFTHLCYFLSLSFVGYCFLKSLDTRLGAEVPRSIDFFFTAVSTATDSSMSTVEMEVFSDSQLLFMTFLMFVGGEVFVSLVGLIVKTSRMRRSWMMTQGDDRVIPTTTIGGGDDPTSTPHRGDLELSVVPSDHHSIGSRDEEEGEISSSSSSLDDRERIFEYKSVRLLCYVVLCYLVATHILGVSVLSLYLALSSSARGVLREKGLKSFTFSLFTTVSTFASCGFLPTNENMIVFRKNTIMQLILIPQVLLGNTLFPPCLRLCVWAARKLMKSKSDQSDHLLRNTRRVGFYHLLPGRESVYLAATVAGFVAVQLALFCGTDWRSEGLKGMNPVEKLAGALFLTVNSRHSGESIVDLATVSTASLVVFVVMMYLPPYTSFLPTTGGEEEEEADQIKNQQETINYSTTGEIITRTRSRRRGRQSSYKHKSNSNRLLENVVVSQLSFLAIFVVLICITERHSMKEDPLNFSVFNIVLEVISAYGNVGFSMGYSCQRRINPSGAGDCRDKFTGLSGRWSDEGKVVLILVMLFGRLKKFNMAGGKAWKLLSNCHGRRDDGSLLLLHLPRRLLRTRVPSIISTNRFPSPFARFQKGDMDAADCFSAIWEEIDRSERRVVQSYLVCSNYEEAASMASAVLKRIRENGDGSRAFEHNDELFEVMESAGMVLVQSLNELGRASNILSELKELFGYPAAVPAEVLLTGYAAASLHFSSSQAVQPADPRVTYTLMDWICLQISAGSLMGVKEFLQDFLSIWSLEDGRVYVLSGADSNMKVHEQRDRRNTLDVETFSAVVELYAVTLLGKHLKESNLAISWLEKAALPEEKRQVLLRRLHSMYSEKTSNRVQGSSDLPEDRDIHGSSSNLADLSEESSKASKANYMPNGKTAINQAIKDISRHRNQSVWWWFRSINLKFGNMCLAVTNGKIVLSCLFVLLCYLVQKKRVALNEIVKRRVLWVKKSLLDLWRLAFSYQVNPLAAVQPIPAATRPGR